MLIDTHCHLDKKDYEDLEKVIDNMQNNIMIACADNLKSSFEVTELTKNYKNVYGTIGFHPTELDDFNTETLAQLEQLLQNKKIVGIGEIGLDYHYDNTLKELQEKAFRIQLDLARKYNLPVVIHSRDAASDTLRILKDYQDLKIDMHCYGYSVEVANELIRQNPKIKFGIGGVLTFKNSKTIKEVVNNLDLKYILLETDSPYLAPEPVRGTKNEPSNVKYVAEYLANMKEKSLEEIENITALNAAEQFDLNIKK